MEYEHEVGQLGACVTGTVKEHLPVLQARLSVPGILGQDAALAASYPSLISNRTEAQGAACAERAPHQSRAAGAAAVAPTAAAKPACPIWARGSAAPRPRQRAPAQKRAEQRSSWPAASGVTGLSRSRRWQSATFWQRWPYPPPCAGQSRLGAAHDRRGDLC